MAEQPVMVARALSRNAPISPQKGRLVADQIRGHLLASAVETLKFSRKKAAFLIGKVLNSAIANAEEKSADIDALRVSRIEVSDGIMMKRAVFGARGRVSRIEKRRCHILIELAEAANPGKSGKGKGKKGKK